MSKVSQIFRLHYDTCICNVFPQKGLLCISDGCLSGRVTSKYCNDGHTSCWPDVKTVTFERPFSREPQVSIGFTLLDVDNDENTRVNASTSGITTHGFTITLGQWANTELHIIRVHWMACI